MSPKHWMRAFSLVALMAIFASAYVGSPLNRPGANLTVPQGQGEGPAFGDADALRPKPPVSFESATRQPTFTGPFVSEAFAAASYDGDLRDLPETPSRVQVVNGEVVMPEPAGEEALEGSQAYSAVYAPDPNVQRTQGTTAMPDPIVTFDGLNNQHNFAIFNGRINPPDTNGDVGPNHYIQTVNLVYGIYSKAGVLLFGPAKLSTLFAAAGTGTSCDTQDRGDPVVNYDPLADRWVMSQFAFVGAGDTSPFYQCFLVSKGPNPLTDGWWAYAVRIDGNFPDYPKVSVWPDAYYYTARMFPAENAAFFQSAFALERSAMLAGRPMRYVQFNMPGIYDSMLAGNVRNGDVPPWGTPNLIAVSDNANDDIVFWRLHVDWANPANSTMSPEIHVDVNPFEQACPTANRDCIPFTGSTSTTMLDALSERVMFNLQYRRIGDTESLWANQTITESGKTAVRWYEFRLARTGNVITPTVYQQGTYNPADGVWRWMGSIAADGAGNAALGYSASSPTIDPQIRYVGRLVTDTLGSLPQAEVTMTVGTGHPTTTNSRWGDYSHMSVDPVDDCTFWYTQEYYTTTTGIPGDTRPWTTRIGAFKFPSCTPLPAMGTLTATVYDAATMQPIPYMPIMASNTGMTRTYAGATNASGMFTLNVLPGTYTVTAGPLDYIGYPTAAWAGGVMVASASTNGVVLLLNGAPFIAPGPRTYNDNTLGNGNGYPEPGEKNIAVTLMLSNTGVTTATLPTLEMGGITAELIALTPGFNVITDTAAYPNIAPGGAAANTTPYYLTIDGGLECGTEGNFLHVVWTASRTYTIPFTLRLGQPPSYSCTFPVPNLVPTAWWVAENGGTTNGNGYIEPGEGPFSLTVVLSNTDLPNLGPANNINAVLTTLVPDVTVNTANSTYPNLAANVGAPNNTPFAFDVGADFVCGAPLDFNLTATTNEGTYSRFLRIPTGAHSAAALSIIMDDVELGPGLWMTATNSSLAGFRISTEDAHSPTHSWVEGEGAAYPSSLDTTLTSPVFDFTSYDVINLDFWHRYGTEAGFDYGMVETSRDGGATWEVVVAYDDVSGGWLQESLDLSPYLAYASQAQVRFHFTSDGSVSDIGWFVDDIVLTANPRVCNPPVLWLSPASLMSAQFAGQTMTHTAWVTNTGGTTLDWATDESALLTGPVAPEFSAAPAEDLVRQPVQRSNTPALLPTNVPQAALVDGTYESTQSYSNPYWDEYSLGFGTPLCDAGCGGSPSHSGDWFLWYGGAGNNTAEEGYVSQSAIIPDGSAWLSFWLRMGGTGQGVFTVTVDGNTVFNVTQAQTTTYANYTKVMVDLSAYADGGLHEIMLAEADPATAGNFSVFVDDVALLSFPDVACGGSLSWLNVWPTTGSLNSGMTGTLGLAFNATGMTPGTYTGTVCLANSDPTWPLRAIPVTLTVLNASSQAIAASSVLTSAPGTVVTYSVMVTNTGVATDTFGISVTGSTFTVTGPSSVGPLAPGASTTLMFSVQIPTGNNIPLTNVATLHFTSQNDPSAMTNVTLTTNVSIHRRWLPLVGK